MRNSAWEVPDIVCGHVFSITFALNIDGGQASIAGQNDAPFSRTVPMQLSDAAGRETHVYAGDLFGDREIFGIALARPSAREDSTRSTREGRPKRGSFSVVCRRRRVGAGADTLQ